MIVSSPSGCFPGGKCRKIGDIRDGASNTISVVEVGADDAVEWMQPADVGELAFKRQFWLQQPNHSRFVLVALADGSVESLQVDVPMKTIDGLLTVKGGEKLGEF
jgi:hypothetical protein